MRRLIAITSAVVLGACQDRTPTAPKTNDLSLATASRPGGGPRPTIDCGERCNRIAFVREGNPEHDGYPTIYSIKPDGTGLTTILWLAEQPAWSPNHQKLAFRRRYSIQNGIGTINPDGTGIKMLTLESDDQDPKFSPDGTKIVFARRTTTGTMDLWIMNQDGTQQAPITTTPGVTEYQPDFSPDGKKLVYVTDELGPFQYDIAVLDLATMKSTLISTSPHYELNPSWSPDGKRIAFQTGTGGLNTACIAMVDPDGSNRTGINPNGNLCMQPSWSPDNKSLAFRSTANGLSLILQATIANNIPIAYTAVTKTQYIDSDPAWAR